MAEITLGGKSKTISTLKVNIGRKSYSIPLAGSLTIAEMKAFQNGADGFDFFGKYIPEDVISQLTMDEFKALSEAWKSASSEDSGVELGE